MIRSVEIENFRGITSARIEGAKRINVLVGPNGTGKTAFLESIFLAGGNSPELLFRMQHWRGREGTFTGSVQQIYDAIWSETFRDPDLGEATVRLSGDNHEWRSVKVRKVRPSKVVSTSGEEEPGNAGVEFIWDGPGGPEPLTPKIVGGKLEVGVVSAGMRTHFIPARANISEPHTANALSQLRIESKHHSFEEAFLREFPMLSDLSVEAPWGPAAIWARIPSGRKLPLSMISGGINHLAGMMLRLAANPRCVLLVDEIENGFFHDRYGSIWRTLYTLASEVDGQIFASTHSLECLKALSEALADHADDVRFIRTRIREREVSIEQLSGETLFGALNLGEVR